MRVTEVPPVDWVELAIDVRRRRIQRELCEHCAAPPSSPCRSRTGRTSWHYYHQDRIESAIETLRQELSVLTGTT